MRGPPCSSLCYNTLLHEHLTMSNVFNRTQTLLHSLSGSRLSKAQQAEYKTLDHIVVESKRFVEHHCCKFKASNIPWYPQVSRCINCILYWKGLLSKVQGSNIGSSVLSLHAKKAGIVHNRDSLALAPDTIQRYINAAYKSFHPVKKNH